MSAVSRYDGKLKSDYAYSDSISVDDSALAKFASDAASYEETSGQWIETENGCWYQNPDGTWPASGWQQIDGNWYFFNAQGYRQTGYSGTTSNTTAILMEKCLLVQRLLTAIT